MEVNLTAIFTICFFYFIVSIFSVSVGGTSLITVPVLISFGMLSKNAVATNMFALLFLSISGAYGFRKEMQQTHRKTIVLFSILTIVGSLIGANLVLTINEAVLKKVIAVVICIIAILFFIKKDLGVKEEKEMLSKKKLVLGSFLIFILGIYGGFFSGGYVTLLSYILISVFGMHFLQVAFITKIFNVLSSLVACAFFCYHSLISFSIGIPLAFSVSLGAFLGAKLAILKGNQWIRNLFIITALAMAVKLLLF